MAHSVSVIIYTRDRPALLGEALASVQRQTARQRIGQVIISEGGSTLESKKTCTLFPDLPIIYFDHRPPMPMVERSGRCWEAVRHPIVAFLHDDDWWAPEHLGGAIGILDSRPDCAGVISNFFETNGPTYPVQVPVKGWLVWLASGRDFEPPVKMLDAVSVMLACLWEACFHYSTMVMLATAAREAHLKVLESGNDFDTDRTFPVYLSFHGMIGYLTKPDVYTRVHPGQDSRRPEHYTASWVKKAETTRWMLRIWPELVTQAVSRFNATVADLDAGETLRLSSLIGEPLKTVLIQECGMRLVQSEAARPARTLRWFFKQICPPVVFGVRRRLLTKVHALWGRTRRV